MPYRRPWILIIGLAAWVIASCGADTSGSAVSGSTVSGTGPAVSSTTTMGSHSGPLCGQTGSTLDEMPLSPGLEVVFDPVVARGLAAMEAVGATVAVQCAASPLYVKGYGSADVALGVPARADTVYEIGSISKQFVAAQIMKLAQDGRLSLADPIGSHLGWLPADWQPITLEQLLSHTGGVPDHFAIFRAHPDTEFDWTTDHTAAELVEIFVALDDRLVARPGTTFAYSNTGYIMLTAVIEQLTGQDLAVALEQALLEPLGLEHTALCSPTLPNRAVGYVVGPDGPIPGPAVPASFFSGAAGICATAGDLIRWERSLVRGAAVGSDGFSAMRTPAVLTSGITVHYGLGLEVDRLGGSEAIFHEGGTAGFSSWLVYYPEYDLMVSVLTNTLGPRASALRNLVLDLTRAAVGG